MVGLIGVTGLAGAGKTTAMRYLSEVTSGAFIYLGQVVLDEIEARGLPQTRESENLVRIDLRREKGPAALAIPYQSKVAENLTRGIPTFIDAIFMQAEFDLLRSCANGTFACVLAINASFDLRHARLMRRPERTFTRDELADRDKTELEILGTGAVIAAASRAIRNEGSIADFYTKLAEFLESWTSGAGIST